MKKFLATMFALPVVGAIGFTLGSAPSACACGEVVEGSAAWHWDEMSLLERAKYRMNGEVPFTAAGERL